MEVPLPPLPPLPDGQIQSIRDAEHLRLLSIGYYIVGGCTALFSSFGLIHFFIGLAVLGGLFPPDGPARHDPPRHTVRAAAVAPSEEEAADNDAPPAPSTASSPKPFSPYPDASPPKRPFLPGQDRHRDKAPFPRAFGLLFMFVGGAIVVIGWTVGGLTVYAGRCLKQRRRRLFTLVMAGINCLHIPFGTAMGVFTFLVLERPSVRSLYHSSPANVPPTS